jgi:hypothetical protein
MRFSTIGKMPRSSNDRSAPSGHRECQLEARFPSTRLGPNSVAIGSDVTVIMRADRHGAVAGRRHSVRYRSIVRPSTRACMDARVPETMYR